MILKFDLRKKLKCSMKKSTLIKTAAIVADALLVGVTFFLFLYHGRLDPGMEIVNLNNSEAKRIATTLFFSKLESVGKISVALLGVLWAFIIYTGNRINIRTIPQANLFIVTNLCLLFSFGLYSWGYDFLLSRIFYHSTIDLEAPIVQFYSLAQLGYFILGIFWFVVTILLCREENLPRGDK